MREMGADAIRYRVDYIMLPMRDGVRLATVVIRPRAEGRYPVLDDPQPVRGDVDPRAVPAAVQGAVRARLRADRPERARHRVVRGRVRVPDQDHAGRAGHPRLDRPRRTGRTGRPGCIGCSSTAENQLRLGAIGAPGAGRVRADELGLGDRRRARRGRIPGLLLPRRRPDAGDVGAVARAVRRPAAAEAACRGRRRRAGPHVPPVLGQRARTSGCRSTPRRWRSR